MDRDTTINELFIAACELPPEQRIAFLEKQCAGDDKLKSEVESLLEHDSDASLFDIIETPEQREQTPGSWNQETFDSRRLNRDDLPRLNPESVPSQTGPLPSQIGVFRIEKQIGRGGMGVVYRATDTKLDRTVAIKALPFYMANDPLRMARFEQEAKTLATLNHPNVAAIHGLEEYQGRSFLILEFVPGPTLEEQIQQGSLSMDEVTTIGSQIAAGIGSAHDAGVVHRDLKPANIKITPEGQVKVLDFGLAKSRTNSKPASAPGTTETKGNDPKASPLQTQDGAIMGTAAYMSPEQARGRKVDQRTDVWSFGVILYECLTGDSYFKTETIKEAIDAILNKPILFDDLPPETTPVLRHLLQRCLERDRKKRLRDMHDVCLALEHDTSASNVSYFPPPRKLPIPAIAMGGLLLAMAALAIGFFSGRGSVPTPPKPARPLTHLFAPASFDDKNPYMDIAADGHLVAYRGKDGLPDGPFAIYLREGGDVVARRLPHTEHANGFSLSPDGSKIAFFWEDPSANRIQLKVIDVAGGEPMTVLTDIEGKWFPLTMGRRPVWLSTKELAVISNSVDRPPILYRVPVGLGANLNDDFELEILAELEPGVGRRYAYDLNVVPGKDYLIFRLAENSSQSWKDSIVRLDEAGVQVVFENAAKPHVTESGHLLFLRGGMILAADFDLESGTVTGEPVTIYAEPQNRVYGYADNGTLVMARRFGSEAESRVMAIQRNGERSVLSPATGNYMSVQALSPSGDQVAVKFREASVSNNRLAILDLATGKMRPVPPPPHGASMNLASWLPDGRLCYSTWKGPGDTQLYVVDEELTAAELFYDEPDPIGTIGAPQCTPNGQHALFIYWNGPRSSYGIYTAEFDGAFEPKPLIVGENVPANPRLSPNGQWLAYIEVFPQKVYIQPFSLDSDQRKNRLVIPNARMPFWSPDGTELFYLHSETSDVMAVRVTSEPELMLSTPEKVLAFDSMQAVKSGSGFTSIEVLPDGRFVYIAEPEGGFDPHLHFILNMDQEIERRLQEPAVQRP